MAGQTLLWPLEGSSYVDVLWSVLMRTGFVLATLMLYVAYLAIKFPDRVPGTGFDASRSMKGREKVYSPPGALPILGHTFSAKRILAPDPLTAFLGLARRSPIDAFTLTLLGSGRRMWLCDPSYSLYIQTVNFKNFVKGERARAGISVLLGQKGILVADGDEWYHQRRKVTSMFSNAAFRDHMEVVVKSEVNTVVALLDTISSDDGDGQLSWTELLPRFTLSTFSKMALSADLKCLTSDPASLKVVVPLAYAFEDVQIRIRARVMSPGWKIRERWNESGRRLREDIGIIRQVGLDVIGQRVKEHAAKKAGKELEPVTGANGSCVELIEKSADVKDLVDFFVESAESEEDMLVMAINFLFAGLETTAQGLSWFFAEMCAHPEWNERVREELAEAGLATATDGSYRLDASDANKLPVTLAAWSESLRLHPSVTTSLRTAVKDDVIIPQGPNPRNLPPIHVKAGEHVGWSDYISARMPSVWGEDCEQYNPLRFLSEDKVTGKFSYVQHGHSKFHVFSNGPRICPGMNLALFEGLSFIAAVVPRYDLGWASKEQGQTSVWPPTHGASLLNPVKGGYVLTIKKRAT